MNVNKITDNSDNDDANVNTNNESSDNENSNVNMKTDEIPTYTIICSAYDSETSS